MPNHIIIDYCAEEVRRQGHDITNLDGIERVGWMLDGWAYALERVQHTPNIPLNIDDVVMLGKLIEPGKNARGLRLVHVRVGVRLCPHPETVPLLLANLLEHRDELSPIDFYKAYEEIHPFADGNGRSGKVILNWLSDSLLRPIFPPADLFGYVILNP